jgi:DNA repair exonuclease SbcCD ATPase subunit
MNNNERVSFESIEKRFDNWLYEIGILVNQNEVELLHIQNLQEEIKGREEDLDQLDSNKEKLAILEKNLSNIENLMTKDEEEFVLAQLAEKEDLRRRLEAQEAEVEKKKKYLEHLEREIKTIQIKIEEIKAKADKLDKKVKLKGEKVGQLRLEVDEENRRLSELNEAVLERNKDADILAVITENNNLIVQRDLRQKEVKDLTETKEKLETKSEELRGSLELISKFISESDGNIRQRHTQLETLKLRHEEVAAKGRALMREHTELVELRTDIQMIKYYQSKLDKLKLTHGIRSGAKMASENNNTVSIESLTKEIESLKEIKLINGSEGQKNLNNSVNSALKLFKEIYSKNNNK